jgi:ATP-binding cassette, subfamily B, bacterial
VSVQLILDLSLRWRTTLALCSVLMLAETGATLAVPWLAGLFAQQLLASTGDAGRMLLVVLVGLFAVQAVLKFATALMLGRAAESILADLRTRLYDHLQALPLAYFHQRRRGETLSLLTNDVARLAGFVSGPMLSLLPLVFTVAGALVLMLRIDARLTAIVAATIPLFYLLLKILGRRLRPLANRLQQAHADAVAVADENLSLLPAIKSYTREPLESARYAMQIDRILRLGKQERRIHAALGPSVQFLAAAGLVLVLWLLGTGSDRHSPAEIVSFLLYAALLTRPIGSLADVYGQSRQARGALERLGEVLAEPPET